MSSPLWCRADLPFGLAQRAHSSYQFFLAAVSVHGYPFSSGPNHPVWVDRRSLIGSPFEDAAHAARRQWYCTAPSQRENTRAGTLQYDIVPYIPRLIRRIGVKTCVGAAGVCRGTVDKGF